MRTGDIVTLNSKGFEFLREENFPMMVKSVFSEIWNWHAEIIDFNGEYARVKLLSLNYPQRSGLSNDFSIKQDLLKLAN
jgi:hypothetical protein